MDETWWNYKYVDHILYHLSWWGCSRVAMTFFSHIDKFCRGQDRWNKKRKKLSGYCEPQFDMHHWFVDHWKGTILVMGSAFWDGPPQSSVRKTAGVDHWEPSHLGRGPNEFSWLSATKKKGGNQKFDIFYNVGEIGYSICTFATGFVWGFMG